MTRYPWWLPIAIAAGCQTAQEPDEDTSGEDTSGEELTPEEDPCWCTKLGDDFAINPDVPNGDPELWPQFPPDAIVSTTCLRKIEGTEVQELFESLKDPVIGEIAGGGAPGIMGLAVGNSVACSVSRTITVWESEEALLGFVTGPAHSAAIPRIIDISRGGSLNSRWKVSELEAIDWPTIAVALENFNGAEN